jgi:hypothetical protein
MRSESQRQARDRAIRQIEALASGTVNRSSDRKVCQTLHRGVTFVNRGVSWGVSLDPETSEPARTSTHSQRDDYTIFIGFLGTPACMSERRRLKFGT